MFPSIKDIKVDDFSSRSFFGVDEEEEERYDMVYHNKKFAKKRYIIMVGFILYRIRIMLAIIWSFLHSTLSLLNYYVYITRVIS